MNCYELFSKVLESLLDAKDEIAELRETVARNEATIIAVRNIVDSVTYSSDAIAAIKKLWEVEQNG